MTSLTSRSLGFCQMESSLEKWIGPPESMDWLLSFQKVYELLNGRLAFIHHHPHSFDSFVQFVITRLKATNPIFKEGYKRLWISPDSVLEFPELLIKWLSTLLRLYQDQCHLDDKQDVATNLHF